MWSGEKYCNLLLIILFNIIHSFANRQMVLCILLCLTNNSIKYHLFVYTHLNDETVLFLTFKHKSFVCTQFKFQNRPIDRALSGALASDSNEGVLHIPHSSRTWASLSDCLMSYPEHSFGVLSLCRDAVDVFYSFGRLSWDGLVSYPGHSLMRVGASYPSAEMQSMYSTASADWVVLWTYYHHRFDTFSCENIIAFALNTVQILYFETLNNFYKFLGLVDTNWIKVKKILNYTREIFSIS